MAGRLFSFVVHFGFHVWRACGDHHPGRDRRRRDQGMGGRADQGELRALLFVRYLSIRYYMLRYGVMC